MFIRRKRQGHIVTFVGCKHGGHQQTQRRSEKLWTIALSIVSTICVVMIAILLITQDATAERWDDMTAPNSISAGNEHTVGLKADGTIIAVGWNADGKCNVNKWGDIRTKPAPAALAKPQWTNNILRSYCGTVESNDWEISPVFGSDIQRFRIRSVTFLDSVKGAPPDCWDVSEAQNNSVLAWTIENGTVRPDSALTGYDLYIAAEGGVNGRNCRELFAGFANVTSFAFNGFFHTDEADDMTDMFIYCYSLADLNLSDFDTSRVTSMTNMFWACQSLTNLDVSGFDTSKVTSMGGMFGGCMSLPSLDLEGFDTSKVTNMCSMFTSCDRLNNIAGLTNWNLSNVKEYDFFMDDGVKIGGRPWEELFHSTPIKVAEPTEAAKRPTVVSPAKRPTEVTNPVEAEADLVTDAFFDDSYTDFFGKPCFYHIPQINLDTPEVEQINQSLYNALYVKLFTPCVLKAPSPQINGIAYTWTVKDHFLSVISAVRITDGNMLYHYATLVDLDTGKSASVEDFLSLYDMTMDDYYGIAQIMIDGELVRLNSGLDKDLINRNFAAQLSTTLSWDNLSTIQPYIDPESGELCIAATLFDIYCQNLGQFRICLTSGEEPVDPFTYRDISQKWDDDGEAAKPRRIKQIDQNFNEEELRAICDSLGVPRDLDVQITQGKPYYWEAGEIYRTEIEIYHNGEMIAAALVNSRTGELAGAIYMYSDSHLG